MATERQVVRKKHGGGRWQERRRTEAGHGATWNNKLPTKTSGDLWLRPYVHLCTKRTKYNITHVHGNS